MRTNKRGEVVEEEFDVFQDLHAARFKCRAIELQGVAMSLCGPALKRMESSTLMASRECFAS